MDAGRLAICFPADGLSLAGILGGGGGGIIDGTSPPDAGAADGVGAAAVIPLSGFWDFAAGCLVGFGTTVPDGAFSVGTAGLATLVFRVAGLDGAGFVILGVGGVTTGAGGTIRGGGFTAGNPGRAAFVGRLARRLRCVVFVLRVFRFVVFAVLRAADGNFGATNSDFGIVAGGCFNAARFALF